MQAVRSCLRSGLVPEPASLAPSDWRRASRVSAIVRCRLRRRDPPPVNQTGIWGATHGVPICPLKWLNRRKFQRSTVSGRRSSCISETAFTSWAIPLIHQIGAPAGWPIILPRQKRLRTPSSRARRLHCLLVPRSADLHPAPGLSLPGNGG